MPRFPGRRPSAAMIVAVIALVMAIAGNAIGGSRTNSKVTATTVKRIVENLAPSLDVDSAHTADRADSARTADKADTANTADEATEADSARTADRATTANHATTADRAKIATNVFSANVNADGTMLGSIPAGATSTRASDVFQGLYSVNFGHDVTGCTISASLATISSTEASQPGHIVVVPDAPRVAVFTWGQNNDLKDRGFYVQMICPA